MPAWASARDFRHLSDEAWERVWSVNLDGTVRCAREAFDLLKASGKASIINLSSIMATKHTRQMAVYSATKGAVSALSRSLAVEYAPYGIRVNTLLPGYVETALIGRYISNPMIAKALLTQTPLRRFGTPQDIANAALFLASDEAAYITGAASMSMAAWPPRFSSPHWPALFETARETPASEGRVSKERAET